MGCVCVKEKGGCRGIPSPGRVASAVHLTAAWGCCHSHHLSASRSAWTSTCSFRCFQEMAWGCAIPSLARANSPVLTGVPWLSSGASTRAPRLAQSPGKSSPAGWEKGRRRWKKKADRERQVATGAAPNQAATWLPPFRSPQHFQSTHFPLRQPLWTATRFKGQPLLRDPRSAESAGKLESRAKRVRRSSKDAGPILYE